MSGGYADLGFSDTGSQEDVSNRSPCGSECQRHFLVHCGHDRQPIVVSQAEMGRFVVTFGLDR